MIELHRLPDWRVRFSAFINSVRRKPFAWGDFDCGPAFTGRMVETITGVDLASPFRGRYTTAADAVRLVESAGIGDLADMVATLLPEIHPSGATVGDISAIASDGPLGWTLGACNGERIFVLSNDGLATVGLLTAKRAFKVG